MAPVPPPTANVTLEPLAISAQQLARTLNLSVRTIRTMDAAGKLPRPVKLNGHAVRWVVSAIESWLAVGAPDRGEFGAIVNAKPTGKRK